VPNGAWPAASAVDGRDEAVRAELKSSRGCAGLRAGREASVGALAACAWRGGACDPSLECRVCAGTSTGEDRPADNRVAEAGVLGWLRGKTGPLQHGARPADCRRGPPSGRIRERECWSGTHAYCQPRRQPGPGGHSQLQPTLRKEAGALCNAADAGRLRPLPADVSAEWQRDMARLRSSSARLGRFEGLVRKNGLEPEPGDRVTRMVRRRARVVGGRNLKRLICSSMRCLAGQFA